jgi:hypothetical protein
MVKAQLRSMAVESTFNCYYDSFPFLDRLPPLLSRIFPIPSPPQDPLTREVFFTEMIAEKSIMQRMQPIGKRFPIWILCWSAAAVTSPGQGYVAIVLPKGDFAASTGAALSFGTAAGVARFSTGDNSDRAVRWKRDGSLVVLHPAGFADSTAAGAFGDQQVGSGHVAETQTEHALFWQGSAENIRNLHPFGFSSSRTLAAHGEFQAGFGRDTASNQEHALLWRGTPEPVVDLHPIGPDAPVYGGTEANCVKGEFQGGAGVVGALFHALIWRGTAASVRDLHPPRKTPSDFPPYIVTVVNGIDCNGYAVGFGQVLDSGLPSGLPRTHALLWKGSASNYVDLHPAGYYQSVATGTSSGTQVGAGWKDQAGQSHALVWNGTPESAFDLHAILPASMIFSYAKAIDEFGNILGLAGTNTSSPAAVLWIRIFEPTNRPSLRIVNRCLSAGHLWLQLSGQSGTCILEHSKTMMDWTESFRTTIGEMPSYFDDSARALLDERNFYRAVRLK